MLLGKLAALRMGLCQKTAEGLGWLYPNPFWPTAAEGCSHWQGMLQHGSKDLLRVRKQRVREQEDAAPTLTTWDLGCCGRS